MKLLTNCYGKIIENLTKFNAPIVVLEGEYDPDQLNECYEIVLNMMRNAS